MHGSKENQTDKTDLCIENTSINQWRHVRSILPKTVRKPSKNNFQINDIKSYRFLIKIFNLNDLAGQLIRLCRIKKNHRQINSILTCSITQNSVQLNFGCLPKIYLLCLKHTKSYENTLPFSFDSTPKLYPFRSRH